MTKTYKASSMTSKTPKPHFVDSAPIKSIQIDEYEISFDPLETSLSSIPSPLKKTYLMLLEQAQTFPKETLSKVLAFKDSCSSSPEVDNLLTYLYAQNKDITKAESLIEESYNKYPDYFFAKINYADQVLRKKQHAKVLEIFPSFELKDNCSSRLRYHVSEYRSFMALMSRYHLAIKQKSKALEFYQKAHRADPAHISVISLEKALFRSFTIKKIARLLLKLFRITNNTEAALVGQKALKKINF